MRARARFAASQHATLAANAASEFRDADVGVAAQSRLVMAGDQPAVHMPAIRMTAKG